MSATARIMAALGIDTTQFQRGLDGARTKTTSFEQSLKSVSALAKVAFAGEMIKRLAQTTKEIEQFQKETGRQLVNPQALEQLKAGGAEITGVWLQAKAAVVGFVGNIALGTKAVAAFAGAMAGGSSWAESWRAAGKAVNDATDAMLEAAAREQQSRLRSAAETKRMERLTKDIADSQRTLNKLIEDQKTLEERSADAAAQSLAAYEAYQAEVSKVKKGKGDILEQERAQLVWEVARNQSAKLSADLAEQRLKAEEKITEHVRQQTAARNAEAFANREQAAKDQYEAEQADRQQQIDANFQSLGNLYEALAELQGQQLQAPTGPLAAVGGFVGNDRGGDDQRAWRNDITQKVAGVITAIDETKRAIERLGAE
jgi:hypothetical protein